MKTKKAIATVLSCMAFVSSMCVLSVSAIHDESQFGLNYWKYNGTSASDTDSNGNVSYHKTYCMQDGASDTNYTINSEGHFYKSNSGSDAYGCATAIWEKTSVFGKTTIVDKGSTYAWGYADAYAIYTSGWGILWGYEGYTYHKTS